MEAWPIRAIPKMWENPEACGLPPRRHWTDQEIALLRTEATRKWPDDWTARSKLSRIIANDWESPAAGRTGRRKRFPYSERPPTHKLPGRWENHGRPSEGNAKRLGSPRSWCTHGPTKKLPLGTDTDRADPKLCAGLA